MEPSGVLDLLDKVFLLTTNFNWREALRNSTRDLIRLISLKKTDMENRVDLVAVGQLQAVGAVVNLL